MGKPTQAQDDAGRQRQWAADGYDLSPPLPGVPPPKFAKVFCFFSSGKKTFLSRHPLPRQANAQAGALANGRTRDFFAAHLGVGAHS
jgi:hypothetical protein